MSKYKKPKRLRRPNVFAPSMPVASGGGAEIAENLPTATRPEATAQFDYSHVRQDLKRIGLLAGSFIVVLVALSFIIR